MGTGINLNLGLDKPALFILANLAKLFRTFYPNPDFFKFFSSYF